MKKIEEVIFYRYLVLLDLIVGLEKNFDLKYKLERSKYFYFRKK